MTGDALLPRSFWNPKAHAGEWTRWSISWTVSGLVSPQLFSK